LRIDLLSALRPHHCEGHQKRSEYPTIPSILGDCCAEVLLENSKLVATTVFETDALA
jgi:hypothetical protein